MSLRSDLDRLFGAFLGRDEARAMWSPAADVVEEAGAIVVRAELPGMAVDDVTIETDGDTLTIRGERKHEESTRERNFQRVERAYGTFERSWGMPKGAKLDEASATFADGVLEIRVPKAEEPTPRTVPISAG
jgi:HSP20 family protein